VRRVALVTGGNRGLGFAIGAALAGQGMHVALASRDLHAGELAAAGLSGKGLSATATRLDVTDVASVVQAVEDISQEYGRLDVLVNNAAIAVDRGPGFLADMERVQATMNTNLVGAWRCINAVVPVMRHHHYGRIINVCSHLAVSSNAEPGHAAYRVSKAGLIALTRTLGAELCDENILVNAVSPGRVETRMTYGETSKPPADAVQDFIWLAQLPDDGPSGQLFYSQEPLSP
jgi:NAD(P)-dependent dehydrogenase (short-subunit alcohol dehydrogenase family)